MPTESLFPSKRVEVLTDENMDAKMGESPEAIWLVIFYVPWCEHTKAFGPKLAAAAQDLVSKNYNIRFGSVDVSINRQAGWKYQINRSPLVKIFVN